MPTSNAAFELSVSLGDDSFSASGKHDLVLKAFEDFKTLLSGDRGSSSPASPAKPRRQTNAKGTSTTTGAGEMSLPAFLAPLAIKGGPKVGTAIVAWSAQHGGKDKLNSSEVQALWKETKFKVPSRLSNVTRDLGNAVKQGLLRKEGTGDNVLYYANAYEQEQVAKWVSADKKD